MAFFSYLFFFSGKSWLFPEKLHFLPLKRTCSMAGWSQRDVFEADFVSKLKVSDKFALE